MLPSLKTNLDLELKEQSTLRHFLSIRFFNIPYGLVFSLDLTRKLISKFFNALATQKTKGGF